MKTFKIHFVVLIVLAAAVAAGLLVATTGRGQSRGSSTPASAGVRRTASVKPAPTSSGPAATRNAALRDDLQWVFGRKPQRGWYLYVSLIGRLVGTDQDARTDDFAQAVERWQKKSGLSASGALDQNSLMAMISQWQRNRLKNRAPATPDQLVLVPASEFCDSGRAVELRQVERNTYEAYKAMVAAALADRERADRVWALVQRLRKRRS